MLETNKCTNLFSLKKKKKIMFNLIYSENYCCKMNTKIFISIDCRNGYLVDKKRQRHTCRIVLNCTSRKRKGIMYYCFAVACWIRFSHRLCSGMLDKVLQWHAE